MANTRRRFVGELRQQNELVDLNSNLMKSDLTFMTTITPLAGGQRLMPMAGKFYLPWNGTRQYQSAETDRRCGHCAKWFTSLICRPFNFILHFHLLSVFHSRTYFLTTFMAFRYLGISAYSQIFLIHCPLKKKTKKTHTFSMSITININIIWTTPNEIRRLLSANLSTCNGLPI